MSWWHIQIGDLAPLNLNLATGYVLWSLRALNTLPTRKQPQALTEREGGRAPQLVWTPRGRDYYTSIVVTVHLLIYKFTSPWRGKQIMLTISASQTDQRIPSHISHCSSSSWTTHVLHSLFRQFCLSSHWQSWNPSVLFQASDEYPRGMFCAPFLLIRFSLLFLYIYEVC
jgi:hypothetical protein